MQRTQSERSSYVALNKRITSAASSTLRAVEVYGATDQRSLDAVWEMFASYEIVLEDRSLNIVNCATLVHRIGAVFSAVESSRIPLSRCRRLMSRVVCILGRIHRQLDARQVANVVWALGNIGRELLTLDCDRLSVPELYSLLFGRMTQLREYRAQEIANCVTGLAKMRFQSKTCRPVLEHLTQIAVCRIDDFAPQELASVIWGLGTFVYWPQNDFIKVAIKRTHTTLKDFTPRQLSNVLWGFARLNVRGALTPLLPQAERCFYREIWNYTGQGMPLVLWSFAKLNYLPRPQTLHRAMHVAQMRLSGFSAASLSHTLYACAIFGSPPSNDLIQSIKTTFLNRRSDFTPQMTCLFLWCLAILFVLDLEFFRAVVDWIDLKAWTSQLEEAEKRQLYQCLMHVQFFVPDGNRAVEAFPRRLLIDCQAAWERGQRSKWRDPVCLAVMLQLQKLGYVVESQKVASRGLARFCVEVVLKAKGKENLVVEVTIPRHSFVNERDVVEGPRRWAMELLKQNGFQILQVDAEIWKILAKTERPGYLKKLLKQVI